MPNGMTRADVGDRGGGFGHLETQDSYGPTSKHQVPLEQFVHELNPAGDCLCGPQVTYCHEPTRVIPMVLHYALDVDYYNSSDWGPDGPVNADSP